MTDHLIEQIAPYAAAAYDPPESDVIAVDLSPTEVYIWPMTHLGYAVVAVRGSTSRIDWLANAMSWPSRKGIHWAYDKGLYRKIAAYDGRSVMREVYRQMRAHISDETGVIWTFHSRGAQGYELALCAPDWVHHKAVIGFGCPAIYTEERCAMYNRHLYGLTYNVCNTGDPIPFLPTWRLRRPGRDIVRHQFGHRMKFYLTPGFTLHEEAA